MADLTAACLAALLAVNLVALRVADLADKWEGLWAVPWAVEKVDLTAALMAAHWVESLVAYSAG